MPQALSLTPNQALEAAQTCFQHTDLTPIVAVQVAVQVALGALVLPPCCAHRSPSASRPSRATPACPRYAAISAHDYEGSHQPCNRQSTDKTIILCITTGQRQSTDGMKATLQILKKSMIYGTEVLQVHTAYAHWHSPTAQVTKSFRLSRCTYVELLRAPADGPQYVDLRFSPAGLTWPYDVMSRAAFLLSCVTCGHLAVMCHARPSAVALVAHCLASTSCVPGYVSTETRLMVSFEARPVANEFLSVLHHTLSTIERHAPTYIGLEGILAARDTRSAPSPTPGGCAGVAP